MRAERAKSLRLAGVAVIMALAICAAASFAAQGSDDSKAPALSADQWGKVEKALSKIEQRLAAIEERLQAVEKDRGPSAFAVTPGGLSADELQKKLKELGPQADFLKQFQSTTPAEKYGGIGAYMSQEDDGPVTITEVMEGKPAARAGLEPGDVICAVGGKNVKGMDASGVADLIKGKPGSGVTLTVERDGKERDFVVTRETIAGEGMQIFTTPKIEEFLKMMPKTEGSDLEMPEMSEDFVGIGIYLGENDEGQPIVEGVMEDTPAEEAGLKAGDVIVEVNGKDVGSTSDVTSLIGGAEGEKVTLTIERDGMEKDVTLTRARITRSALLEGYDLPALKAYQDALKGQTDGLKAYEQAMKVLKDADAYKDIFKAHPEAAEAYKKALQALQEKDLTLKEIPEGWGLYEDDEDEDSGEAEDAEQTEVRKEIKILTTDEGEPKGSLMIKVGPDGEARTFKLEDGEWIENDAGGTSGFEIIRPETDGTGRMILRSPGVGEHEIILGGDDEDEGLVRKDVKVLTTGDGDETRCLMLKVGPDGKACTFELEDGEWIQKGDDGTMGFKVVCPEGAEGKCMILQGPQDGEVGKVIKVIAGSGECCEGAGPCTGECKTKGQSWMRRLNPCDSAGPPPILRGSSAAGACTCGGACMASQPAPCAQMLISAAPCGMAELKCADGVRGSGDMQFFKSLDDDGKIVFLCRPKGSLQVMSPKGECCGN
jgi:C-terminal processing protease CtpA/Prc